MNHAISITAGRQKVIDFEAEMAKRLESLPIIEADILNVGRLRMRWLDCVANIDGFEADLFRKKLDVMKLKSELAAVRLTCEMARIESCYEAQALNQLIAATKPYEHHETDDHRNMELKQTSMRNLNELKENLINSVKVRDSIASKIYYLIGDCERQKLEFISYRETVMEELSSRISTYMEKLTESMEKSKTHHKTIIGEYLVLRHNAKVAKDILARNQKKNQDERVYLQEQLDKLILESEAQKEKMEKITAGELKVLTNDIRTKVILKERELEEVTSRLEEAKAKRKSVCSDLKSNLRYYFYYYYLISLLFNIIIISKYERKYDKLQIKRQRDLKEINGKLIYLAIIIIIIIIIVIIIIIR